MILALRIITTSLSIRIITTINNCNKVFQVTRIEFHENINTWDELQYVLEWVDGNGYWNNEDNEEEEWLEELEEDDIPISELFSVCR